MTWVIGASTIFGYGIIVSDICVQFSGGQTRDIIQKVYPVGHDLTAGFAGSVKIGFSLIDDLKKFLILPTGEEDNSWHPDWVVNNWSIRAREIFDKADSIEKRNRSELLIVGASPDQAFAGLEFPKIYICTLKSPNFIPEINEKPMSFCSIGSGSEIKSYMDVLINYLPSPSKPFRNLDLHNVGWGQTLMVNMTEELKKVTTTGISKHLHICTVTRGSVQIGNNDHVEISKYSDEADDLKLVTMQEQEPKIMITKLKKPTSEKGNEQVITLKMPHVAQSYKEFLSMYDKSKKIIGCIC